MMEDMSDLRLVLNCGGSMRLVFEGRAHKLKYTEVTAVINENITLKPARLREQRQVQEMLHQFTTAKLGEEDYITEVFLVDVLYVQSKWLDEVLLGEEPCIVNKTTVIDPKEDISLGSLTAEFLKSSIGNIAYIMDQFIDQDPDDKRSSKARWDVLDVTSCYPEILHERKRTGRQLTILDGFIIKK
ncbi:hypothetical protein T08_4184 [Trichinella sp. T8]|nr:hypothetical protein T08_4184 [Trichinella sp. T8]